MSARRNFLRHSMHLVAASAAGGFIGVAADEVALDPQTRLINPETKEETRSYLMSEFDLSADKADAVISLSEKYGHLFSGGSGAAIGAIATIIHKVVFSPDPSDSL